MSEKTVWLDLGCEYRVNQRSGQCDMFCENLLICSMIIINKKVYILVFYSLRNTSVIMYFFLHDLTRCRSRCVFSSGGDSSFPDVAIFT